MRFIYLYHGDLYSDLWKSDLYFRLAAFNMSSTPSFTTVWNIKFFLTLKINFWTQRLPLNETSKTKRLGKQLISAIKLGA